MADLRKAKMQIQLGSRATASNCSLYFASVAYFWEKNHEEFEMYSQYNTNAKHVKAIQSLIKEGMSY
jgi:hypothetical protein